ncbi:type III-A CRISPR-associated protein Cas10/Csm1 [Aliarcobacter lanthieri]|uniref:type III-A CRISPR-associated protein Cas10/Csm1 n=1 Tax=Aliarcobacter lanthieri TaxID=1355374 RepID=UPI003AAF5193
MSKFEDYFNIEYKNLEEKQNIDLNSILKDNNYLISGDFYGIQKFIFEGLASKNAAKVLRAKSAFIQLFTVYIAKYICHRLKIDEKNILSTNAGKFEIISSSFDEELLNDIQNIIDKYFIKNYFGLSGLGLSFVECSKEDFSSRDRYRSLRDKISKKVELAKYKKFSLLNQYAVLSYDNDISNQNLCKLCNMRKSINDIGCNICDNFVKLGQELTTISIDKIVESNFLGLNIDDFVCDLILDKKIKSYIAKDEKSEIIDFEALEKSSQGLNSIAVLKADVDNMGTFLQKSDVTNSFENFNLFSKTMDNFFSLYIPKIMKEKYKNSYTVFAGGDDLFLLGSWDTILELARTIEDEFKKFVKSKDLSISFGISLIKHSTPINFASNITEKLLENSKSLEDKDAISFFGETVKWQGYKDVFKNLYPLLSELKDDEDKTAFFYILLEFCDMSKKVKKENDIKSTIWKSKLNYSFNRNMKSSSVGLLNSLNQNIQEFPEETKMVLCEYIYKRRKI